jgi:CRP-like cAMP-binding protein
MPSPTNRLLASLPPDELERLRPDLEVVELRRGSDLKENGSPTGHVYFPDSGAISIVTTSPEGSRLETGAVGVHGMLGVEAFFGAGASRDDALVLLPGVAQRMSSPAFERHCTPGTTLYEVVRRYARARMVLTAQSAVCDATHSIRHRCIRRLLALHDAAANDHFPLTQQVLAALLGVRRASVSVAAEKLQAEGLILYEHGRMHVADRAGLEKVACGCYGEMRQAEAMFLPSAG